MATDYEYFTDGTTGENLAVDRQTGEVSEAYNALFPYGTQHVTPKQQEENKRKFKAMQERKLIEATIASQRNEDKRELGNFYFYNFSREGEDALQAVSPATKARALFLASFIRYDGTGKLWQTKRTRMTKKLAKKVLCLSNGTFHSFWNEAEKNGLISVNENKQVVVSNKIFQRGEVASVGFFGGRTKVYVNAIRSLYHSTPTIKHRYLWLVFDMLPYMSLKFNILCTNPFEEEPERVQPLSMVDLCKLLYSDASHVEQLREVYASLNFWMNDAEYKFCVIAKLDTGVENIIINPRVVFMGKDWRYVEGLMIAFQKKAEQVRKDVEIVQDGEVFCENCTKPLRKLDILNA